MLYLQNRFGTSCVCIIPSCALCSSLSTNSLILTSKTPTKLFVNVEKQYTLKVEYLSNPSLLLNKETKNHSLYMHHSRKTFPTNIVPAHPAVHGPQNVILYHPTCDNTIFNHYVKHICKCKPHYCWSMRITGTTRNQFAHLQPVLLR